MSTPKTMELFNLPRRVESTVMTHVEQLKLSAVAHENEQRKRIGWYNPLIVGVVESLVAYARSTDWRDRLAEAVLTAVSKEDYEADLFHYTTVRYFNHSQFSPDPQHAAAVSRIAEEDTLVKHLPVPVRTDITEWWKDMSLREIFQYKYLTLPLLSHYLGPNLKVVSRRGDVIEAVEGVYEVRHERLVVKYFPDGIPLGEAVPLNKAKEIWGLKTTYEDLISA